MITLLFQESMEIPIFIITIMYIFREYDIIYISSLILLLMLMFFYRVPYRVPPTYSTNMIIAPCNGEILKVITKRDITQIIIHLSVFDVHVQWYPTHGTVRNVFYKPGQFNIAKIVKKSNFNERMTTIIQNEYGIVRVDQIAGQLARRIVNWSVSNSAVKRGELMGMIKLSSRVDVYLPTQKVDLMVKSGDVLMGNISTIAKWKI
jgi:phosphatidylserine decarboxylase